MEAIQFGLQLSLMTQLSRANSAYSVRGRKPMPFLCFQPLQTCAGVPTRRSDVCRDQPKICTTLLGARFQQNLEGAKISLSGLTTCSQNIAPRPSGSNSILSM